MFELNNTILYTENIYAGYGKREILKNVSLKIYQGEVVSLVGPNGAGKSTLLKTIVGLLLPKSGKIIFRDKDITFIPAHRRANLGIGYLFQGGAVFTNLTVEQNLKFSLSNLNVEDDENRLEKIYNLFPELEERRNFRAGLLSGGLKQMLSLGMILIREPELLLLDEPSAGLAPALVKSLIEKVKELNQKEGKTILLVEQNIRQALQISHRAYLMKNGEIVKEEPNPEDLLKEENFEKVFFET